MVTGENNLYKNSVNHLSVEIDGGFSFLLIGDHNKRIITNLEIFAGSEVNPPVDQLLSSSLTDLNYKTVSISVCNDLFSLVPESLFEKDKARELLSLNVALNPDDLVFSVPVHHLHARLLFAAGKNVERLQKKFPHAVISHCFAFFLNRLPAEIKGGKEFHICFYPGFFFLAACQDSAVLFCNVFSCKSAEDVLYFLLFTAEQLKFDRNSLSLHVSGEIEEHGELFRMMNNYFIEVNLAVRPPDIRFSGEISVHGKHRFHNLTDQFRCAL